MQSTTNINAITIEKLRKEIKVFQDKEDGIVDIRERNEDKNIEFLKIIEKSKIEDNKLDQMSKTEMEA